MRSQVMAVGRALRRAASRRFGEQGPSPGGAVPGGKRWRGRIVTEAVSSVRRLEALGHADPIVLGEFPVITGNPAQALMLRRAWDNGIAPVDVSGLRHAHELHVLGEMGLQTVLHLHWTSWVLRRAHTEADRRQEVERYLAALDAFRDSGGQIVWTVHNVLPHDSLDRALDTELQLGILERASIVHVMTQRTADSARGVFDLPAERVLYVPHPSYTGAYPDIIVRDAARQRLGIEADALVYLAFGAIRPNKGLADLVEAFIRVSSDGGRRRRLLIAGEPDQSAETRAALEKAAADPFVRMELSTIPSNEVQVYFRAADAVVMPYRSGLNSGVLMLAYTFGLPVVTSDVGAFGEFVGPSTGRTFLSGDVDGLTDALRAADELLVPREQWAQTRAAVLAVARQYDPDVVSDALMKGIRERVTRGAAA